jgi:peptidoglycan biosynthesis protein MviN/MurJ (putative lipid II flippase)
MNRMAAPRLSLRRAALLIAGAFAVHQLRFVVSYGDGAGRVLSEPGHEYLPFAGAAAATLILMAAALFGRSLVHAKRGHMPEPGAVAFRRLWIENAIALVAMYVAQEGIEGAVAPGHPIWAHGGWTVVPLAIAVGGLVALLVAGANKALAAVARSASAPGEDWSLGRAASSAVSVVLVELDAVARHLAGRAPPRAGLASR